MAGDQVTGGQELVVEAAEKSAGHQGLELAKEGEKQLGEEQATQGSSSDQELVVSKIGREQLGGEGASEVSGSAGDQVMTMTEDGRKRIL